MGSVRPTVMAWCGLVCTPIHLIYEPPIGTGMAQTLSRVPVRRTTCWPIWMLGGVDPLTGDWSSWSLSVGGRSAVAPWIGKS